LFLKRFKSINDELYKFSEIIKKSHEIISTISENIEKNISL